MVVIVAVIAAAGGLGIGYLLGTSRGGGGERRLAELQAQLTAARENANRLGVQSAELEREAERLRGQLLEAVQQGSQLGERTRQLELRLAEERQETAQNLKLMAEAREAMENMFKSHAADALRNNNQSFLELAKATLAEFQQGAKGDLEKRQLAIDQLVGPVRASLDKVDEKIVALERTREHA